MTVNEEKLDALSHYIDMLLDAICVVDEAGCFVYVSSGAERIFGYKPEEMTGMQMLDMVHPDDRNKTLNTVTEIKLGHHKVDFENRYIRKDGRIINLLWSARWSEDQKVRVAVARDITKNKRAEAQQTALFNISEAAHAQENLPALYNRIHQIIKELMPAEQFAIALYDGRTDVLSFAYKQLTKLKGNQDVEIDYFCCAVSRTGQTQRKSTKDQAGKNLDWLGVPLKSQKGIIGALIIETTFSEVDYTQVNQEFIEFAATQIAAAIERKQMIDRLQKLAMFDQLTALPNRQLFSDRLSNAIAIARRNAINLALLYIDLDSFKEANDNFGHRVGDLLLKEVANRLKNTVRDTDTVARFGGDEFVILLEGFDKPEAVEQVTEKILLTLSKPYHLDEFSVEMSASIGIAIHPENGVTERELLHNADISMYEAKHKGGNRYQQTMRNA
ncbi:diguanylate cyclase domain-containing protein [Methylophaga sp.]|uniref:diguanylate cyclase domain-containing protein n=1 Tax=Methylophaga sp. TaxID=2024840 RepID=UPI003F69C4D6